KHADTLSLDALRRLVTGLVEKAEVAETRLAKLETENAALREENAALRLDNTRLKVENQLLRDEIARLKNLPPRPPFRPSGMDKATNPKPETGLKKKPRGVKRDMDRIRASRSLPRKCQQVPGSKGIKAVTCAN